MQNNLLKRLATKLFMVVSGLAPLGGLQLISVAPAFSPTTSTLAYEQPAFDQHIRVGLQVGHWHNQEPPTELAWTKRNTGAQAGEYTEFQSNYLIAMETKKELESHGLTVDILPAIVPPKYEADVFVTIHADGSPREETNGYKVASPRNDITRKAHALAMAIEQAYGQATQLRHDPEHITENMTDYYAFAWHKFEHAISKETPAAILETGFVTSEIDRQYIIHNPEIPARGLAQGIINYLQADA